MLQQPSLSVRWFFSALVILATALPGAAQEVKPALLRGTIRRMDLSAGVLTLLPQSAGKTIDLGLASKDLPITNPLGQSFKITDLYPGLRVIAKVRNDEEIIALRIDGPYLYGTLQSVDATKKHLVIKTEVADRNIQLPADIKVVIDGKESTLQQCRLGNPVQILYTLDRKTVMRVEMGKLTNPREPYSRLGYSAGTVLELDQAKRRMQVFVESYDIGVLRSYVIDPDVQIRLYYRGTVIRPVGEISFERFSKWVKVRYWLDHESDKIVGIHADLPHMSRRRVVRVEAAKHQLTIRDDGRDKAFEMAPDVRVITPRGNGALADIRAGHVVDCGLSLDRSQVLVIYLWEK